MDFALGFHNTMAALSSSSAKQFEHSPFSCRQAPPISTIDYARRLHAYMYASDQAFAVACVYLARLHKADRSVFGPLSCHKLMLGSIVVAAKFTDDKFYANTHYAEVGGVGLKDLNQLELQVLRYLEWQTFVAPSHHNLALAWMTCPSPGALVARAGEIHFKLPPLCSSFAASVTGKGQAWVDDWETNPKHSYVAPDALAAAHGKAQQGFGGWGEDDGLDSPGLDLDMCSPSLMLHDHAIFRGAARLPSRPNAAHGDGDGNGDGEGTKKRKVGLALLSGEDEARAKRRRQEERDYGETPAAPSLVPTAVAGGLQMVALSLGLGLEA